MPRAFTQPPIPTYPRRAHPQLGYDIDPAGYKLTVNAPEAEQVWQIFALYREHESLLPVVEELVRRNGWQKNKVLTAAEKRHKRICRQR